MQNVITLPLPGGYSLPVPSNCPSRWPRLMRRSDVAEYLSVSDRYIDTMVDQGHIPGPKLTPSSRVVLWDRSEIDRWIDDATPSLRPTGRSFDDLIRSGGSC